MASTCWRPSPRSAKALISCELALPLVTARLNANPRDYLPLPRCGASVQLDPALDLRRIVHRQDFEVLQQRNKGAMPGPAHSPSVPCGIGRNTRHSSRGSS
jgi:hypothetical protein